MGMMKGFTHFLLGLDRFHWISLGFTRFQGFYRVLFFSGLDGFLAEDLLLFCFFWGFFGAEEQVVASSRGCCCFVLFFFYIMADFDWWPFLLCFCFFFVLSSFSFHIHRTQRCYYCDNRSRLRALWRCRRLLFYSFFFVSSFFVLFFAFFVCVCVSFFVFFLCRSFRLPSLYRRGYSPGHGS